MNVRYGATKILPGRVIHPKPKLHADHIQLTVAYLAIRAQAPASHCTPHDSDQPVINQKIIFAAN